jgi:hypothetical protein
MLAGETPARQPGRLPHYIEGTRNDFVRASA